MSIRGNSLFVKVVGQGYPVVLMHGGPGLDHTTLLPLPPCADRFTLVDLTIAATAARTGPTSPA